MKELFSQEETEALVLARVRGGGAQGATRKQIDEAIKWAELARIEATLLDLCLRGEMVLCGERNGEMRHALWSEVKPK